MTHEDIDQVRNPAKRAASNDAKPTLVFVQRDPNVLVELSSLRWWNMRLDEEGDGGRWAMRSVHNQGAGTGELTMAKPITCWVRTDTEVNAQCAAFDPDWADEHKEDAELFPFDLDPAKARLFKVTISAVEYRPSLKPGGGLRVGRKVGRVARPAR